MLYLHRRVLHWHSGTQEHSPEHGQDVSVGAALLVDQLDTRVVRLGVRVAETSLDLHPKRSVRLGDVSPAEREVVTEDDADVVIIVTLVIPLIQQAGAPTAGQRRVKEAALHLVSDFFLKNFIITGRIV